MALRLVKPGEDEAQQPKPPARLPERARPSRQMWMIALVLICVLLLLGAFALALSVHVSRQAEGYELTLEIDGRTTHVLGTNVTLSQGASEAKCVLSLLDFRSLREKTQFLATASTVEKKARGLATFELALTNEEPPVVTGGTLPLLQLEPIERFVLLHASACIKTYVPAPSPGR